MIRRRVSLVVLAALAIVLGFVIAGTPNTGQSPKVNEVDPTSDTLPPLIDTLPSQGTPRARVLRTPGGSAGVVVELGGVG